MLIGPRITVREPLWKSILWFGPRVFARQPISASIFLAGTAGSCLWYYLEAKDSIYWPGGGSRVGLSLGIVAGLIIFFECLLWLRKCFRSRRKLLRLIPLPLGSAQWWLRAHIWLGLLSVPLVLLHGGIDFGSPLTTVLAILFFTVIASGVYGLYLQHTVPRELLDDVPAETVFAQIKNVAKRELWEAEDMVTALCGPDPTGYKLERDAEDEYWAERRKFRQPAKTRQAGVALESPLLRDAFYKDIAGYLAEGNRGESRLNSLSNQRSLFADLRTKVEPEAQEAVSTLERLCDQRRQFDRQSRLHIGLHLWLWLHLPLSAALLVLLLWHVYTALYYI